MVPATLSTSRYAENEPMLLRMSMRCVYVCSCVRLFIMHLFVFFECDPRVIHKHTALQRRHVMDADALVRELITKRSYLLGICFEGKEVQSL
jgi:hypothetical protein